MRNEKKTEKANLENRRAEMFLIALVLILSLIYCALEWRMSLFTNDSLASIEDIIEDFDFDHLKKDYDMVAAISEITIPEKVTGVIVTADMEQVDELLSSSDETLSSNENLQNEYTTTQETPTQLLMTPINDHESLLIMQQMPEFPGGAAAFMKWLTANIKYPTTARDRKIEGKIVVSFIVDEEGNTTNLILEETSNQLLAAAVMAAMHKMPQWKPGIQNGKNCATMIRVPINFNL